MKPDTPFNDSELRGRAEDHLRIQMSLDHDLQSASDRQQFFHEQQIRMPLTNALQSAHDRQKLLRELQILQVELEMQNEELRNSQAEVEAGLARYSNFYDFSPAGFVSLERNGTIILVNLAGANLLDKARAQLAGHQFESYVTTVDRPAFNAFLQQVFATETRQTCEVALRGKDGALRTVQIEGMLSVDGQECHSVVLDITERKLAESNLQLAACVFTHAREGIMITDTLGNITRVNDAFTRITSYSREEVLGQNPRILKSGLHSPEYYAEMWQTLKEQGYYYGEVWNRRKNGETYAAMQSISAVRDSTGKVRHYVALYTDITLIKKQQQQLEHIAHYDALTNLPNRLLLSDRLRQAIVQCRRRPDQSLAVAYLDLDGFKEVNDTHGHDIGDQLLIAVAQRMKAALRESDTLARIGGDEFIAVLVDLKNSQDYEIVLDRLLQAAAAPITVGDAVLQVSASIGVTLSPQDGTDADLLLRHADQAMYIAKKAGKNRYHLSDA